MPLSDCEPYQWYLVIKCERCGRPQPMYRDPSNGKAELLRSYWWRCVECLEIGMYEPHQVERYQHVVERREKPR